ncbi:MAG: DNA polymerase III subunit beta [Fibrobacteria bacterium]|nr:DNA polymerase III subunit beta [Fibrobacteria bacterium]
MKFEVNKGKLFEALQVAQNAVPNKTTLQVLNNFLFNLQGNELEITATDLDLTIVIRLEVEGIQDGGIVVNAKKFLEVIRELPDLPVNCVVDNDIVTIQSGESFQCNIVGYGAEEYPGIPEDEDVENFSIQGADLKFLFENSSFAVSNDFTTRVSLTGVYWEYKDGELLMVGTDGHRFGKAWLPLDEFNMNKNVILPTRAITQVLKIASGSTDAISVSLGKSNITFKIGTVTIISKCIEGPYPEYEKVIPQKLSREIKVNKDELVSVLRRVATMAHSKTRQVKFAFEKDTLNLSARNIDMGGETKDTLPANYSGKEIKVGFNSVYVLEVLKLIHTEEVRIKLNSNLGATIFEPDDDSANFFFIVMPLRLLEEE